jgi:hypothetical protein
MVFLLHCTAFTHSKHPSDGETAYYRLKRSFVNVVVIFCQKPWGRGGVGGGIKVVLAWPLLQSPYLLMF